MQSQAREQASACYDNRDVAKSALAFRTAILQSPDRARHCLQQHPKQQSAYPSPQRLHRSRLTAANSKVDATKFPQLPVGCATRSQSSHSSLLASPPLRPAAFEQNEMLTFKKQSGKSCNDSIATHCVGEIMSPSLRRSPAFRRRKLAALDLSSKDPDADGESTISTPVPHTPTKPKSPCQKRFQAMISRRYAIAKIQNSPHVTCDHVKDLLQTAMMEKQGGDCTGDSMCKPVSHDVISPKIMRISAITDQDEWARLIHEAHCCMSDTEDDGEDTDAESLFESSSDGIVDYGCWSNTSCAEVYNSKDSSANECDFEKPQRVNAITDQKEWERLIAEARLHAEETSSEVGPHGFAEDDLFDSDEENE